MKKIILTTMFPLYFIAAYSQQADSLNQSLIREAMFSSNHISFSVMPFLPPAFKITNSSNQYIYEPIKFIGLEAAIHYRVNLRNNYVIVTGINGGFNNRNFHFAISKDKFTPNLWSDMDIKNHLADKITNYYLSVPVLIEKMWETKTNNYWNAFAGINLRYYWGDQLVGTWLASDVYNSPYATIFLEHELIKKNSNKLLLSLNTGAGYSVLLKNYDFLRFNLNANLSPSKLVKYNYKVPISGQEPLTGTYTLGMSYVGVSVEYIFTGTRLKIKEMLE